jgi:hypothetical protein
LGSGRSQRSSPAFYFDGVVEPAPLPVVAPPEPLMLPGVDGVPAPLEPGVVALRDGAVEVPLLPLVLLLESPQPTSASTLSAENAIKIRLSINTSPHAIASSGHASVAAAVCFWRTSVPEEHSPVIAKRSCGNDGTNAMRLFVRGNIQ